MSRLDRAKDQTNSWTMSFLKGAKTLLPTYPVQIEVSIQTTTLELVLKKAKVRSSHTTVLKVNHHIEDNTKTLKFYEKRKKPAKAQRKKGAKTYTIKRF